MKFSRGEAAESTVGPEHREEHGQTARLALIMAPFYAARGAEKKEAGTPRKSNFKSSARGAHRRSN